MSAKKKLEEGDIFYVEEKGKYIFGKILMDVSQRILKIESTHKYKFFSGCYLIEVYAGIFDEPELTTREIILPGQFTFKKTFYSRDEYKIQWIFYSHESIDYKKLDFPETLETGDNGMINLRKCDLSIPTNIRFDDFPKKENSSRQKFKATICGSYYELVDNAFHFQGRDELLRVKRKSYLDNNDIRLDEEYRKEIYSQIGESTDLSYYELSQKHGLNIERFY